MGENGEGAQGLARTEVQVAGGRVASASVCEYSLPEFSSTCGESDTKSGYKKN